jgi:hypothetical protein
MPQSCISVVITLFAFFFSPSFTVMHLTVLRLSTITRCLHSTQAHPDNGSAHQKRLPKEYGHSYHASLRRPLLLHVIAARSTRVIHETLHSAEVYIQKCLDHSSRYHHRTLEACPVSELVQPIYLNHNTRSEVVYFHPYHVPYTQPLVTTKAELPPSWHQ